MKAAVFVSGGGTNLQSLIDAEKEGYFDSKIALVVSDNPRAYGLVRAEEAGIRTFVTKDEKELRAILEKEGIELILLAGYLRILSKELIRSYENRIINIHPSILPLYGGKGMYGLYVHEAVFEKKEEYTGATVHFVTEEIDGGKIILQEKMKIDYEKIKSAEELQKEVLKIEHRIFKEAVRKVERG